MFYINTKTGEYPVMEGFIRSIHPSTSFTEPFVAPEPFAFVAEALKPEITNPVIQTLKELPPVMSDGKYYRAWKVVSKFSEYTDEDGVKQTVAMQEAAAMQAEVDARWAMVRADRNQFLAACDWTQLPDAPVDAAAWAEYRQALRDITDQSDPFNIVWPQEPE